VRVVDPHGSPEPHRNGRHLLPEPRDDAEAGADHVEHLGIVRWRAFKQGDTTDVHGCVGPFEMEEELIEDGETVGARHTGIKS
jgi:hypothetical protein